MATPPKRLGRGLGSIIAGGTSKPPATPAPPKKHKKELSSAPASRSAKGVSKQARPKKEGTVPESAAGFREIEIGLIDPSPYQMRREFDEESLKELAESISAEGLMQPVTVRLKDKRYELIAGERRFRACKMLKLRTVTARVVDAPDSSAAAMALIENLQRENLNPIDEALGFASLMEDFNLTQDEVSQRVGKGRANVANHLRLLRLNKECQGYVSKGMVSFGHARALLGLDTQQEQTLLARQIMETGMSVRDTESRVNNWKQKGSSSTSSKRGSKGALSEAEQAAVGDLERRIASTLNTKVAIRHSPKKGTLSIEYYGNEDLQRILERLGIEG